MRRQAGFTLIELLITITIFLLVVPAIISSVMLTQKTSNRVNQETLIRQNLRSQLDRMMLEIRKARAFFAATNTSISQISGITDEMTGLQLPNGHSDTTAAPYVVLPPRGSALAFMVYEKTVTISTRQVDIYRLVAYYLKKPTPGMPDYDAGNSDALALRRFESTAAYYDTTGLVASENTAAVAAGYTAWTPPGPSVNPTLPTGTIAGRTTLMTNAVAPANAWVRGKRVPSPGGFAVVQDGNAIAVHLMGYAAKETFYLQSQTLARNYVL